MGVEVMVSGGLPLIGEAETTVSMETSFSTSTGSSESETQERSIQAKLACPPYSKCNVIITGDKYTAEIPYTANIKKTYFDGTSEIGKISGVYHGVTVTKFMVQYGKQEKL